MLPDTILRIGSQELIPLDDCYRFVIHEVLPQKGYKFVFGIRKRIIDEMIKRATRLEVIFTQFPEITFKLNPIEWLAKGKLKKEIKLFKDSPMKIMWYYVAFNGELTRKRQPEGQVSLI